MTPTPISESDWLKRKITEARTDPVGLWQIVKAGRESYRLTGPALENFVRSSVEKIMLSGALPIFGDENLSSGWRKATIYSQDGRLAAKQIVSEWVASERDPDFGDVWFAFPGAF